MKKKNIRVNRPRLIDENTPFAIREAFNMLRTNLLYTVSDVTDRCPIYAITSAGENAGKSTVIANLALSFTNLGKRVLLIDGDMRCPTIFHIFDKDIDAPGLSELISGVCNDVVQKDVRPGLDLITSGRIPPNPSELITGIRFTELLESWKETYDVIFIDFPPVDIVSDSLAVCQQITGYIFAVRSGKTRAATANNTIHAMEQVGARIVGVVLNDYSMKGSTKYGYNDHYSRYYRRANAYNESQSKKGGKKK